MSEKLEIGSHIIFTDENFVDHHALVTAIWTGSHAYAEDGFVPRGDENMKMTSVNLVFVAGDKNRDDQYGRQIDRNTSILYKDGQGAGGFCWRFPDESKPPMGSVIK